MVEPVVVLLSDDRTDWLDDQYTVSEDAHDVGAQAGLPVLPFGGVARPHLVQTGFGAAVNANCLGHMFSIGVVSIG